MHAQATNPYSQYVIAAPANPPNTSASKIDKLTWRINTLQSDAEHHILAALQHTSFDEVSVRCTGLELRVESKNLHRVSYEHLARSFYEPAARRVFAVRFLTPTAFKQKGQYVFWPDPRLVLQSLAVKHSALVDGEEPGDDLVCELAKNTTIVRYTLRTQPFPIQRSIIPGFVGTVTYRVSGPETLESYVAMLLSFGEFCGCGIKTSMGMGGIRLLGDSSTAKL